MLGEREEEDVAAWRGGRGVGGRKRERKRRSEGKFRFVRKLIVHQMGISSYTCFGFRILIEDALMPTCQHGGPPSQPARTPEERARAQRVSGMKGELEGVGWAAIWVLRSSFGPSLRAQSGERPSPNETAAKSGSSSVDHESCFLLFLREKCIVLSSFPLPSIINRGIGFGHFVTGSIHRFNSTRW